MILNTVEIATVNVAFLACKILDVNYIQAKLIMLHAPLHVLYVRIANYMQAVPKYTHNYIIDNFYKFKCSPVSIIIMGISKSCSTLLSFRLIILVITVEL